jgi:hypothetical protein
MVSAAVTTIVPLVLFGHGRRASSDAGTTDNCVQTAWSG